MNDPEDQPNYDHEKLAQLNKQLENTTNESERQAVAREIEAEMFSSITPEKKSDIEKNVEAAAKYVNDVLIPMQKFVYPDIEIIPKGNSTEMKLKIFEFEIITKTQQQAQYFIENLSIDTQPNYRYFGTGFRVVCSE
jgi:hypothetical protein